MIKILIALVVGGIIGFFTAALISASKGPNKS